MSWIFTDGEGDEIEFRLPFKIFSTLSRQGVTKCYLLQENIAERNRSIIYYISVNVYDSREFGIHDVVFESFWSFVLCKIN